jgi:3-hydroxyacyl-CoA dehydrogenase
LGKTTVLCKDTPTFIANRIGVFSMMTVIHLMDELGLSVEEIDTLTGPVYGRPKSATFRTADVVGLDTFVKVAKDLHKACPNDEARDMFKIPAYVEKMAENKWLGDKTRQGFYKKTKNAEGKTEILALDLKTFEYQPKSKPRFDTIGLAKTLDGLKERVVALHKGKDKAGEFYRQLAFRIFQYISNRIPEIADEVYKVDDALKAGFGWEVGPFEMWDWMGVSKTIGYMEKAGYKPSEWVYEMITKDFDSFYKSENGTRKFYDREAKSYRAIPGQENFIILDNLRGQTPVWKNSGSTLHDLGDGVLNLEFQTKMNTMGSEIMEGVHASIKIAEEQGFRGLVVGNEAANFSVGANLAMIFMLAIEQEFDELDLAVRQFQQTTSRLRFSSVPVVAAPHGMTLGGGCELSMHADGVVAAAELYMGLVEVGVGVIPGGGGTKEFALRASDRYFKGDVELPTLQEFTLSIAMAKVATSAHEAFELGMLRPGIDEIVLNKDRLIATAKQKVIELADAGYTQPAERKDIKVLGKTALGSFYGGISAMKFAGYISDHDELIAKKAAYVICGGDLSAPTEVSESYLLDLEREAFLSLLFEKKTLERIQHMLNTGKPLRN